RQARADVPMERTWDLEGLFPDPAAWEADLAGVEALITAMAPFHARLGTGADTLLACLRTQDQLTQAARRVYWYASNRLSEDQTDPGRQSLMDRATAMWARARTAISFIEPELLALKDGTVEAWLDADTELALYRLYLTDILAEKEHLLGQEGEEVLARMTELFQAPLDIWKNTTNADITYEPVIDEHGRQIPMSLSALNNLLQSPDRTVRQAAYHSVQHGFAGHKRTLAATFAAAQKRDVILARVRRYPSALAAALGPAHLPEELFHVLLQVAESGAEHFRRYLRFRQRALGVDRLMPWDLQAPLDPEAPGTADFPDAFDQVQAALDPLGSDYALILDRARHERWVDWADNQGKRSGAYSSACYGHHPVILLNWQGRLSDTFTLAHELGHAAHAILSEAAQPYPYSHSTLFLAEMASTTNELLLARYLLDTTGERVLRRAVLTRALGAFTSNFFGGAQMAALQQEVHQMVERGQPLTYESITEVSTRNLRRWYGDMVDITEEAMGNTWMRPTHHYLNFYSYQYATGIAAAAAFSDAISREGAPAVERYLGFLRAGSSAHSIDILRDAGVDMTTSAPLERAVAVFASLVDELEAL
ncbi:MAG TPA: oligoendopeptidase F, partial [Chloroflexota bacterium]|nr:oligoendopeptidase F [Chloroflexota bacterium]